MKQIFFAIFLLITINVRAQAVKNKELNCEVLIDINYEGSTSICDSTGKIITKLKINNKDSANDVIFLTIIGKNESMYKVIAATLSTLVKGWIRKDNSHIGIYTICSSTNIDLYEKPDENSKIQSIIKVPTDYLYVRDCENNWLFISEEIGNKKYEGWLSPIEQCSNPYSTCCGE